MKASQEIRDALARVAELRQAASRADALAQALQTVKRLQAQRFAGTYPDLLANPRFSSSVTFFLEELYSAKDYSDRDAQFARIAGAIERTFPDSVVATVRCQQRSLTRAVRQEPSQRLSITARSADLHCAAKGPRADRGTA